MLTTMDGADKVTSALETTSAMVPYMSDVMLVGMVVDPTALELVAASDSDIILYFEYKIIVPDALI